MTVGDFIRWWAARLGELVPPRLRLAWRGARTTVAVQIAQDRIVLRSPGDSRAKETVLQPGDESVARTAAAAFRAALPAAPQQLLLELAPREFLLRQFTLPRAARLNLFEAVGYQVPKQTPFSTEQVVYACGVMPDAPKDGALPVWLVAIPRQRIAQVLGLLGLSMPDTPPQLTPPEPGEPLEFSWDLPSAQPDVHRRMRFAWLGLALAWTVALGMHVYNRNQLHAALDNEATELRARAAQVFALRQQLQDNESRIDWIATHQRTHIPTLDVLEELTTRLDDDTALQNLELNDGKLTIRGVSRSPAKVIETLEASALLKNVRFDAAITRAPGEEGDRFNLSAELAPPTGRGGA